MQQRLDDYFEQAYTLQAEIYQASDYSYIFHFQNVYFGYRPDASGNQDLCMIPLHEMLTRTVEALEKLGWVDARMERERIVELNLLYLGLLTMIMPNNLLAEEQFARLVAT